MPTCTTSRSFQYKPTRPTLWARRSTRSSIWESKPTSDPDRTFSGASWGSETTWPIPRTSSSSRTGSSISTLLWSPPATAREQVQLSPDSSPPHPHFAPRGRQWDHTSLCLICFYLHLSSPIVHFGLTALLILICLRPSDSPRWDVQRHNTAAQQVRRNPGKSLRPKNKAARLLARLFQETSIPDGVRPVERRGKVSSLHGSFLNYVRKVNSKCVRGRLHHLPPSILQKLCKCAGGAGIAPPFWWKWEGVACNFTI